MVTKLHLVVFIANCSRFLFRNNINMDRTALFKATVKTIRTKNKALGVKEATRDILGSKRQKSEFGTRAKDVVRSVRCDLIKFSFISFLLIM